MYYSHNRDERDIPSFMAICEVCEEERPLEETRRNQAFWGIACCDGCVEGGLECGALPLLSERAN